MTENPKFSQKSTPNLQKSIYVVQIAIFCSSTGILHAHCGHLKFQEIVINFRIRDHFRKLIHDWWKQLTQMELNPICICLMKYKDEIPGSKGIGHGASLGAFLYCFYICDTKCTFEDTAIQPAQCFLLTLQFVGPKPRKFFFALTKHVNAVSQKLHWTACWKKMPLALHGN